MSAKTSAEVIIGGKVYTLSGYESEEYLQKVAGYINNKLSDLNDIKEYRHLPVPMKATLVELNIADDYFKSKSRVDKLERELEQKEKEIYDLKHDLISTQIKIQAAEAETAKLESENQKLLLDKTRLETTLQDAMRMEETRQTSKLNSNIKTVPSTESGTEAPTSSSGSNTQDTSSAAAVSSNTASDTAASLNTAVDTVSSRATADAVSPETTAGNSSQRRRTSDRRTSAK